MGDPSHKASVAPYFHRYMRPDLYAAHPQGHLVVIALNLNGMVKDLPRSLQSTELICRHHYNLGLCKVEDMLGID
jgi:hypothetical protein